MRLLSHNCHVMDAAVSQSTARLVPIQISETPIMIERSILAWQWLADLDARLFLGLNRLHQRGQLETLVRFISFTGDGYLYLLMGLSLPLLFPEQGTAFLLAGLLAFVIELPIYCILKKSFKRRRPFHVVQAMSPVLKPSDEFSFPSGHTTAAFMIAGITSICFPGVSLVAYTWAALIGLSRVMLRVHFISDVLAGMLLGSLIAYLSLSVTSSY
ncbi:MAG: phosphatase PAP2 family protein [Pseudohongiella sp.]|uniref:phosphatase PAP2 family protein n=1 Tax=Pseudohongiella sp. TaxID=1979412 RepID=UPI00349FE526